MPDQDDDHSSWEATENAADDTLSASPRPLGPGAPQHIGKFHIRKMLASGGMGTVYEATQESPRRVVAIKLMRHGITSRAALRRFEYEAQVLARLRHPGVAQIYEAGTHDDGSGPVPYFAMEYIPNARPITDFAKDKKLGTRRKLELFAHACDAVHHGHQKGIIHRDLKPANVLVDSHGEVKIIDFGVARGTDSDLAVTTLQTDIGQLIGTLQYMSPEQCEGDPHDIDTRSDVYALGVVLYELLAGKLPYDVSRAKIADSTRIIREQQPTRLSTIDAALKGDIETVVFKAMEKDRDLRYQSATELAQDIRRYLAGEPIVARPPSLLYQMRIFARRHKGLFASLAAVFILLVTGFTVATTLYVRAEHERRRAVSAEAKAGAIADFLIDDMLASADPEYGRGQTVTVQEMLENAANRVGTALPDNPQVAGAIRATIGRTYLSLGLPAKAEPHLLAAVALQRGLLGESHPDTLRSCYLQGTLLRAQGKPAEAERLLRETLPRQRAALGNQNVDTIRTMRALANAMSDQGRDGEATELTQEAIGIARRALGPQHLEMIALVGNLGTQASQRGNTAEAEKLTREALENSRRILGPEHPVTILLMGNLAKFVSENGNLAEGEKLTREALEVSRRVRGPEHPGTILLMGNLANFVSKKGNLAEAEKLTREALENSRHILGPEHPQTIHLIGNLAADVSEKGNLAEAEKLTREALEISRRILGPEHPDTIRLMFSLSLITQDRGSLDEAEELARQALEISRRKLDPEHPKVFGQMGSLAWAMLLNGSASIEEINSLATQAYDATVAKEGKDSELALAVEDTLAAILLRMGRADEACSKLARIIETTARLFPADAERMNAEPRLHRGLCLTTLARFDEAQADLLAAYEFYNPRTHPQHRQTRETLEALIALYEAWNKPEEARRYREALQTLPARLLPSSPKPSANP